MFVLLIQHDDDGPPAAAYGPFDTIEQGQLFAEDFRTEHLPDLVQATPENNEAWTERGWYFAIVPVKPTSHLAVLTYTRKDG